MSRLDIVALMLWDYGKTRCLHRSIVFTFCVL